MPASSYFGRLILDEGLGIPMTCSETIHAELDRLKGNESVTRPYIVARNPLFGRKRKASHSSETSLGTGAAIQAEVVDDSAARCTDLDGYSIRVSQSTLTTQFISMRNVRANFELCRSTPVRTSTPTRTLRQCEHRNFAFLSTSYYGTDRCGSSAVTWLRVDYCVAPAAILTATDTSTNWVTAAFSTPLLTCRLLNCCGLNRGGVFSRR